MSRPILSIILQAINGAVFFRFPISISMIARIFVPYLIISKSEIWIVSHCLGLGQRTLVCALCPSICWCRGSPFWRNSLITWWRHQMETFSALLATCAGNSPVTGEFPAQGQWRGALTFSLICAWINGWVNNREAGDSMRHRAHYDVTVIYLCHLYINISHNALAANQCRTI